MFVPQEHHKQAILSCIPVLTNQNFLFCFLWESKNACFQLSPALDLFITGVLCLQHLIIAINNIALCHEQDMTWQSATHIPSGRTIVPERHVLALFRQGMLSPSRLVGRLVSSSGLCQPMLPATSSCLTQLCSGSCLPVREAHQHVIPAVWASEQKCLRIHLDSLKLHPRFRHLRVSPSTWECMERCLWCLFLKSGRSAWTSARALDGVCVWGCVMC